MKNLGSRLEKAYEAIDRLGGIGTFADIGSDHAYLSCEVLLRGNAKLAIASDVNPGPLGRGKDYAAKTGVSPEFILSDGFDAFDGRKIDCAAICGMGGELTAGIIKRSSAAKRCFLVLQPMSAQEFLRGYLWDNGFEIIGEDFAVEHGKPYVIITAKYSGVNTPYVYPDLFLGKVRPANAEFASYALKVLSRAEKSLLGSADRFLTGELIGECQRQITNLSPTKD